MEKRKNSISALKICRFCLGQDDTLSSLYDRNIKPKNDIHLPLKILSCLSIEVFPSDKMPTFICQRCQFFMEIFYDFKEVCRTADERIMQYVQGGTSLETLSWPRSLLKIFRMGLKAQPNVMRTVTEDGATVQVTSQDLTDSEDEDEENVFNIKIGDGSQQGPKCIKVVTSKNEDNEKSKPSKEFSTVSKLTRHLRTHAGERRFPCKYCNKSFLRSHHHTRHVRLTHRDEIRSARGLGPADQFRCEQCEQTFESQDELIYHSAIHATQNLTCPLCQEKFEDVDAVTAHIKSHVNGMEFMCDLCELVFTSKDKLDTHLTNAHAEELDQEESMEDMDAEEDEDDTGINVKEEGDHMVVEIKKPDGFMLPKVVNTPEEKADNTNSEDSEVEATYTELSTVDTLAIVRKENASKAESEKVPPTTVAAVTSTAVTKVPAKPDAVETAQDSQTASILRKAQEVKRKAQQISSEPAEKKEMAVKMELGASDKSLRLLEKELQELKRTNTRNEAPKTPVRTMETLRNRRPQLHTSTPKTRAEAEKKALASVKSPVVEKKVAERKVLTKENKEPKDAKETKTNSTPAKEERERKEEKETPKSVVKNGSSEKSPSEETVRRSTRPSKIKDYAKMIRDKSQDSNNESDDADDDDEYKESPNDKTEGKGKPRRSSVKPPAKAPAPAPAPASAPTPARKRGRPRKDAPKDIPSKIKKEDLEEVEKEKESEVEKIKPAASSKPAEPPAEDKDAESVESAPVTPAGNDANQSPSSEQKTPSAGGVLMSPTGQTLKKVPIKALPPGIKPLPLPVSARSMGAGELCEMQIGKKVVKVQKIVMTKAEVEAMAKKGLVEMKDGTMVLKQGIKIPTSDALSLKSTLVGDKETGKESPIKPDKPSLAQSNTSE